MVLLTTAEAKQVINNFKTLLRVNSKRWGNSPNKVYTGAAFGTVAVIDEAIATHGVRFVGSVMEDARRELSFDEPWFYYETRDLAISTAQDEEVDNFENAVAKLIFRLEEEIARQQEEQERREQERSETQQEEKTEKRRKKSKAEIKDEYRHVRRQLQQLVRRRKAAGKPFVSVPKIPKKITEGSIRNLQRRIAKIKLM